jgi:DNA-binding CsgD family transcriptional regulator
VSDGRPAVVLLRDGPAAMDAAATAMRLAGWAPSDEPEYRHRFIREVVTDPTAAEAIVLAVAAGCGAVVAAGADGAVWSRFVRAVEELADTCRWETTALAGLSATQIELLALIGAGERVSSAARAAAVSERSAHRQLVDARARLGARTNSHAATIVRAGLDRLR